MAEVINILEIVMKFGYIKFFILSMLLSSLAYAEGVETQKSVLVGEFEGAGVKSQFLYQTRSGSLEVSYFSPSLRRNFHYVIDKFDECSSMAIYAIPGTRRIAIDGSCSSRGGQIFTNIYQWKGKFSNWCLIREITGERADDPSGTPEKTDSVLHTSGCILIGESAP
jgi:hypothetical protein